MGNGQPSKAKSFLKEKGVEIAVGLLLTIISVFIIGRIDKLADTQIEILQQQSVNTTEIINVKKLVEGLAETQGSVQGASGDNAVDIRFIRRDIEDLEERVKGLENK